MLLRSTSLLTLAFLLSCATVQHVARQDIATIEIQDSIDGDLAIEELIRPYREELGFEMNQIIGLAAMTLTKNPVESTLGNWVADAVLTEAKVLMHREYDFAICNLGGLRIPSLPAGPVRKGKIYELMPFDNYVVTMALPGKVIKQLFDQMASENGWPISAGVHYEIKDGKAQNILLKGTPLDEQGTYDIVLSDYLANGGSRCDFLKDFPYQNLNLYYRDALIQYTMAQQSGGRSLSATIEGRVTNLDKN